MWSPLNTVNWKMFWYQLCPINYFNIFTWWFVLTKFIQLLPSSTSFLPDNYLWWREWVMVWMILLHTFLSYEHDANILPYLGWAHATCQTGPSWLYNKLSHEKNRCCLPSQCCNQCLLIFWYFKYFHSSVWGTGSQSLTKVIHLCIMLQGL